MKIADIRGMRPDELQGKLDEIESHVFSLRAQAVTEKLENSNSIKNARRDIARVKTVMREKQLKGQL